MRDMDSAELIKVLDWLARPLGYLVVSVGLIRVTILSYQGFRTYVLSELPCCKVNLRTRYGQWALVTGATDGIGLELALELARRGHSVILVGRNPNKLADCLKKVEAELRGSSQALTVQLDLADLRLENFEQAMTQIDAEHKDIGLLINNAGVANERFAPLHKHELARLRDTLVVNSVAPILMSRLLLPGMLARGRGLIVNVSSVYGFTVAPFSGLYGASKRLNMAFSEDLRLELTGSPIDVVDLSPGFVTTKMLLEGTFNTAGGYVPFQVAPDAYAKRALNSLGARQASTCGHPTHGLLKQLTLVGNWLGLTRLMPKLFIYLTACNYDLSL